MSADAARHYCEVADVGREIRALRSLMSRFHAIPGDGDCMFHAIAFALHELGFACTDGPSLRSFVISVLQDVGYWKQRFILRGDRLAYVQRLSNGAWGDSLVLDVLARELGLQIVALDWGGAAVYQTGEGLRVEILYNGCNHYDALRPVLDSGACSAPAVRAGMGANIRSSAEVDLKGDNGFSSSSSYGAHGSPINIEVLSRAGPSAAAIGFRSDEVDLKGEDRPPKANPAYTTGFSHNFVAATCSEDVTVPLHARADEVVPKGALQPLYTPTCHHNDESASEDEANLEEEGSWDAWWAAAGTRLGALEDFCTHAHAQGYTTICTTNVTSGAKYKDELFAWPSEVHAVQEVSLVGERLAGWAHSVRDKKIHLELGVEGPARLARGSQDNAASFNGRGGLAFLSHRWGFQPYVEDIQHRFMSRVLVLSTQAGPMQILLTQVWANPGGHPEHREENECLFSEVFQLADSFSGPSLVMGDFNTEPEESWVLEQIQGLGWHDLVGWHAATCRGSPKPTSKLNDRTKCKRIDYMFGNALACAALKDIATVRTVVNGHASIVAAFDWKVLHARKVVPRVVLPIHVQGSDAQLVTALKRRVSRKKDVASVIAQSKCDLLNSHFKNDQPQSLSSWQHRAENFPS